LRVPRRGHVDRLELAGQERLLQLEAQQDVQVVGRLVGLDPDKRALDLVDREDELVERHVVERSGKSLAGPRIEVLPEWRNAADASPKMCCRSTGYSRVRMSGRGPLPDAPMAATSGTRSLRSSTKTRVTSAAVIPGSYSSSRAS